MLARRSGTRTFPSSGLHGFLVVNVVQESKKRLCCSIRHADTVGARANGSFGWGRTAAGTQGGESCGWVGT